jgi:hypothetical protein
MPSILLSISIRYRAILAKGVLHDHQDEENNRSCCAFYDQGVGQGIRSSLRFVYDGSDFTVRPSKRRLRSPLIKTPPQERTIGLESRRSRQFNRHIPGNNDG